MLTPGAVRRYPLEIMTLDPASIAALNAGFRDAPPEEILRWAVGLFGSRITLASSFGVEDTALIAMCVDLRPAPTVFFLDTGRLHQETYETVDRIRARYGVQVRVYFPRPEGVEGLVSSGGYHSFYDGSDARKRCCEIRKIEPLKRALQGHDAWITGLRQEQALSRAEIAVVELDGSNGLIKVNPLAHWRTDQIWNYVKSHNVPYNPLHDRGFPSIGCAPCTRAIGPGEDLRAGRWWWEAAASRECGLHK